MRSTDLFSTKRTLLTTPLAQESHVFSGSLWLDGCIFDCKRKAHCGYGAGLTIYWRIFSRGGTTKGESTPAIGFAAMETFLHFVTQDWYFAIPMLGMSTIDVTLVVWRLLLNFNVRTNMNAFLPALQDKLQKEGVEGALKYCQTQP